MRSSRHTSSVSTNSRGREMCGIRTQKGTHYSCMQRHQQESAASDNHGRVLSILKKKLIRDSDIMIASVLCVTVMSGLIHTGLGSSSIIAHVLHSPPPPPREQLCNRSCSNKHTHTRTSDNGDPIYGINRR